MSALEATARKLAQTEKFSSTLLDGRDIDEAKWAMTSSERARVRPANDWQQETVNHFTSPNEHTGAVLPWSKTHADIRLRPGELSIWAGVNGHGKSMLLSQVALSLVTQGESICIASLEMKPVATLARMARQACGRDELSVDDIHQFFAMIGDKLWLYDQQGTIRHDRMLAVTRYAREELGVNHFVIDSLMKCGINGDDYNAQKRFVDCLSTYARDSNVHIHLVAHSRKRESEHQMMDKFDIKGASEITDMADNVFTLWRNKPKEEKLRNDTATDEGRKAPDAVLACDKQRHGEWEGKIALWFNPKAFQYVGENTPQTIDYLRFNERQAHTASKSDPRAA